ncbi:MAG: sugar ABC transporter ATP-binding protein [Planctomycetota bacterium]|jgi:ribose transport system ATP-binding protein|nr:sugar ABC transporter ATP-binding protein [Planctomycetota bacterium]
MTTSGENDTGKRIPAIEAAGINIGFNGVPVLHDVDFTLEEGEVHALVGMNGAGKSTLVKILNGFYRKDSGSVRVFGKQQDYDSPQGANRAGIAMVYQDLSLAPSLTVAQNIYLMRPFRSGLLLDDRRAAREALALFDRMGIEPIDPHARVEEVSPGQAQLVEIAKALSLDAKILILDEPTASLSNVEIGILFATVERLKKGGISIVYITHYLKDVFRICDRVTILRDGQHILTSQVADLTLDEMIDRMLGGESREGAAWTRHRAAPDDKPLLEARDIATDGVEHASFTIYPGQIVGLAGLLGSGRTEITRAIYGLDRLRAGEILVAGKPVAIRDSRTALNNGISLVPEDRRRQGLVLDFSIADNMVLPILRRLSGLVFIDRGRSAEVVRRYFDHLDVKATDPGQQVRLLSGGNQQKVVVGKFLACEPSILLLDDPTFGIDIHAKRAIMRIVKDFAAQGNGVLFISSELHEIAAFCDVVHVVRRRRLEEGMRNDGLTEDDLLAMVQ